jgi:hypothetical protein
MNACTRSGRSSFRSRSVGGAEREDVQPVVEVLAQLADLDGFHRVDVGRRDHAHVNRLLHAPAEAPELPLLQHPQQLDLSRGRHLANLIEEQRAAIRELETALPPVRRAGERPFSWPKISLSRRVSGIAAQLMPMNRKIARGLS